MGCVLGRVDGEWVVGRRRGPRRGVGGRNVGGMYK